MNYLDNIKDKKAFTDQVKQDIRNRVFGKLEDMKKQMANEFIKTKSDE